MKWPQSETESQKVPNQVRTHYTYNVECWLGLIVEVEVEWWMSWKETDGELGLGADAVWLTAPFSASQSTLFGYFG